MTRTAVEIGSVGTKAEGRSAALNTDLQHRLEEARELYQPANGTEGADFMSVFCDRCQHDAAFRDGTGDSCPIVANTMVFNVKDEGYPREWIYGADGEPTCTAFTPTTALKADAVGTAEGRAPSQSDDAEKKEPTT